MKTLNKTLMTSAAALALVAGSAFAQDVSTTTDTNTGVNVEAGDSMSAETGTSADATTDLDASGDMAAEGSADTSAEGTTEMTAEGEMATDQSTGMMADAQISDEMEAAADLEISTLIGTSVTSQDGNDVGEIDSFVEDGGKLWAIIGIGGFLGIGEHDVAIDIANLSVAETNDDGAPTEFMISNHSEADLKAMAEYDNANATTIDGSTSLRSALNM